MSVRNKDLRYTTEARVLLEQGEALHGGTNGNDMPHLFPNSVWEHIRKRTGDYGVASLSPARCVFMLFVV